MASIIRPISSATATAAAGRRFAACASSASKAKLSLVQLGGRNPALRRHISCHHHNRTNINNGGHRKRRAFSTKSSSTTSSKSKGSSQAKDKQPSKSSQQTITGSDAESPSIEQQLSTLQAEIAHLSYLIKQTSTQQLETASLSRRAEARSYIIEHKLMDIQSHVVKIPEMEHLTKSLRQYLEKYSPSLISDAFLQRGNTSSAKDAFINKYTIWATLTSLFLFYRYRVTMYQRTSEEVADIAAMTLQQDTLRCQIQETLATVANSPSTLASLSSLFQQLISEERTQQHLIDLIVRALGSEGVRLAAVQLLDVCFQNEELQRRAGEFLKVAAKVAVLDEEVQKSAGVGIQQALKSAVLPWWVVKSLETTKGSDDGGGGSGRQKDDDGSGDGKSQLDGGDERSNNHVVVNANGREDE